PLRACGNRNQRLHRGSRRAQLAALRRTPQRVRAQQAALYESPFSAKTGRAQPRTATRSISTSAPSGKAATPIVERAGYGSRKYCFITSFTAAKFARSV